MVQIKGVAWIQVINDFFYNNILNIYDGFKFTKYYM